MRPDLAFLLLLITAFAPLRSAAAEPADSLFTAALSAYEQADYRTARDLFRAVEVHHGESGAVAYNLGNAYYRMRQIGEAIRYYERARRLGMSSERLEHNLALARSRTTDRFAQLRPTGWAAVEAWLQRTTDPWWLFYLGAIMTTAAAFLLAARIVGRQAPHGHLLLPGLGLTGLLLVATAYATSVADHRADRAVVLTRETAVRAAPGAATEVVEEIHEGTVVRFEGPLRDGFRQVTLPDGRRGFVQRSDLGTI